MVEGARLESVCRGNLTEGSNPSLSASPAFALSYSDTGAGLPSANRSAHPVGWCSLQFQEDLLGRILQGQNAMTELPPSIHALYVSAGWKAPRRSRLPRTRSASAEEVASRIRTASPSISCLAPLNIPPPPEAVRPALRSHKKNQAL